MFNKILFINSQHSDYLEDLVFCGLNEILGSACVIPSPIKVHHYFSRHSYPKNIAQCRNAFQFVQDNVRSAFTPISKYDVDVVVLGSTKKTTFETYIKLFPSLPKHVPIVYIDGGDREEIGGDAERLGWGPLFQQAYNLRPFDIIFKREMITGVDYPHNVFPLPLAFKLPAEPIAQVNKKYQVVFWCVESHPIRTQALDLLANRYDCSSNGTIKGQTFKQYALKGMTYLSELASAKIAINFRGGGWDTLRYWEIPGVNSFMLSGKSGMVIPHDFEHEKHAVFCKDDLSDFTDLIDYYLVHDKEREEIASNGYQHLLKHHTHLARTKQFLAVLESRLS